MNLIFYRTNIFMFPFPNFSIFSLSLTRLEIVLPFISKNSEASVCVGALRWSGVKVESGLQSNLNGFVDI